MEFVKWLEELVGPVLARLLVAVATAAMAALADAGLLGGVVRQGLFGW